MTARTELAGCEQELVARYLAIVGIAKDGAALFCRSCGSRVVYRDGRWQVE